MAESIVGLGSDIVAVSRIEAMLKKYAETFCARHFTPAERAYCDAGRGGAQAQRYAARFAAKEACAKALGTGIGAHAGFKEIEVVRTKLSDGQTDGPPQIHLHGNAAVTAERLGVTRIFVTLAHERQWATATVILSAATGA